MDISQQIANFRPGITISRSEFTPEIQETLMRRSLGIPDPEPRIPQGPAINPAEYEAMKTELANYKTVFSAPGVAENIGHILGVIPQQQHAQPAPAPVVTPPPVQPPQPAPTPAPDAGQGTPAPQQNEAANWWDGVFGKPSDANANPTPNPTATPTPQTTDTSTIVNPPQPANAPQTPAIDTGVQQYVNAISAQAISRGVNPQSVIAFYQGLDPAKAVELYEAANKQPAPTGGVNLAEHNPPAGPIKQNYGLHSIGAGVNPNAFRV